MYNQQYPQVQLRPFINVIDGQPPVYPQFAVNPNMQRCVGIIGTELIKAIQSDVNKNIVRSTSYNYLSDNNYNNALFQEIYNYAVDFIEAMSINNRCDPASLIGYIPELVRTFIAHIWMDYVRQPLDNETRHFVENAYKQYQQFANVGRSTYQAFQYNQNPGYGQFPQVQYQNPVNMVNNYPQQSLPQVNTYNPMTRQAPSSLSSGDRFSNYQMPTSHVTSLTTQATTTLSTNQNTSLNRTPMASTTTHSRFTPIDDSFNKQKSVLDKLEKGFESSVTPTVELKDVGSVSVDEIFGNTVNTQVNTVEEEIEWYPTESQRYPIIYSPFSFECKVVLNEKGHPVQTFKRIKLGEGYMNEEDHITDIIQKTYGNGDKPTMEEIKRVIALEKKLLDRHDLSDDEIISQNTKASETKPLAVADYEVVENGVVNIDTLFEKASRNATVNSIHDASIVSGIISKENVSDEDLEDVITYLANAVNMDHVVSKLMKMRKNKSRLYYKLVDMYTEVVNKVVRDKLGYSIDFDDLIEDYPELSNYLGKELDSDIFVTEVNKEIASLLKDDNETFTTDSVKDSFVENNITYYYNRINTPVVVASLNYTSKGLSLGDDVTSTKYLVSSIIQDIATIMYSKNYSQNCYIETMDNKRYRVTRSAFNKEVYTLRKV